MYMKVYIEDAHSANDEKNTGNECLRGRYTRQGLRALVEHISYAMGDRWHNIIHKIATMRTSIKRRMLALLRLFRRPNSDVYEKLKTTLHNIRGRQLLKVVSKEDKQPVNVVETRRDRMADAPPTIGLKSLDVAEAHLGTENHSRDWAVRHALGHNVGQSYSVNREVELLRREKPTHEPDRSYREWDLISSEDKFVLQKMLPYDLTGCETALRTKLGLYLMLCDYRALHGSERWPNVRRNLGFDRDPIYSRKVVCDRHFVEIGRYPNVCTCQSVVRCFLPEYNAALLRDRTYNTPRTRQLAVEANVPWKPMCSIGPFGRMCKSDWEDPIVVNGLAPFEPQSSCILC